MRKLQPRVLRFTALAGTLFSGLLLTTQPGTTAEPRSTRDPPQIELALAEKDFLQLGDQVARLWTHASGERQVSALLVAANYDQATLRKENGACVTVPLTGLCAGDQKFVREQLARSGGAVVHEVRKIVVPPVDVTPEPESKPALPIPGNMAYVRISREHLAKQAGKVVRYRTDIVDNILGTSIRGIGDVEGKTNLVIFNDPQGIRGELRLTGQLNARTTGYNGPVQIGSRSVTHFKSAKAVVLDEKGLRVGPAVTAAITKSSTTGISSNLGGIGDRIARSRASGEVAAKRPTADKIAADHAEARINRRFDADVAERVNELKSTPMESLGVSKDHPLQPQSFRCKTAGDFIYIAVLGAAAAENGMVLPPRWSEEPATLQIYLHATVVDRAMNDREVQRALQPLLANFAGSPVTEIRPAGTSTATMEPSWVRVWSDDHQWLTLTWTGKSFPTIDSQAKSAAKKIR